MPQKSKSENAEALAKAGMSPSGWTIPQWCARRNISESHYRKMREEDRGKPQHERRTPREKHMGRRVIITEQADAEWAAT